ncbi:MAG: hypothetical protein WCO03_00375, partial [bacterium]
MNKNILIGLLIGVVVVGGIAYWVTTGNLLNTTFNASSTTDNASNVVDKSVTVLPGTTPSNPTRKAGQPLINSNTRVVLVSNSTVLLNGGVTPNGSHTTYWYEYGQTNSLGNKSTSQVIGSGFNNIPVPNYISGLKANTTYQTRVVAQNAYGQVKGSVTSFTTNTNPPPVGKTPAAQTNATENITRVTADLNGKVNPNNSPTGYWFEYGETTDLGNVTNLQSAGSGSNQQNVSASLSDLKPTTKYYFRLNAQNDFGTTNSALSNFTTQGPPAPGLPTARTDQAS